MALGTVGPGRAPKGKYVGGYGGTASSGGSGGNNKTLGGVTGGGAPIRPPLPSGMMKGTGPAK